MTVPTAHLASVGTCLPGEPVDNATLAKLVGIDEQWAEMLIGNISRYFAVDLATGQARRLGRNQRSSYFRQ